MFEKGGVVPSKKCSFWCNGPSIKAPQIPLGHQKKLFWRYFYRIWRYSKMQHFLGASISPKKWTGGLSCMCKGQKCIQTLWDHQKKFVLLKTTKNARYVQSLGKRNSFWGIHRGKKRCCAWSGALKRLPKDPRKCKSLGAIRKMFIV